jgi:hypothetical protein
LNKTSSLIPTIIITVVLILLLAACSSTQEGGAVRAVEAYIQALNNKDSTQISILSCADWEQDALLEVDSLTGVNSQLENLACQQVGQEGADTYISCTGVLALDYNGEAQQIDLSARTYIAHQENGEWRMCGYH